MATAFQKLNSFVTNPSTQSGLKVYAGFKLALAVIVYGVVIFFSVPWAYRKVRSKDEHDNKSDADLVVEGGANTCTNGTERVVDRVVNGKEKYKDEPWVECPETTLTYVHAGETYGTAAERRKWNGRNVPPKTMAIEFSSSDPSNWIPARNAVEKVKNWAWFLLIVLPLLAFVNIVYLGVLTFSDNKLANYMRAGDAAGNAARAVSATGSALFAQ